MLIEVIAVPLQAPPTRIGARFTVRDGVPLTIGPSPQARIRLTSSPSDKDLIIDQGPNGCVLRVDGVPTASSLNGEHIERNASLEIHDGDHLFISGGLVIRFGERVLDPRDAGLERAIADDVERASSWAVYADFLLERGAAPLRSSHDVRALGPLANAVQSGAVAVEWGQHGFLKRVHLQRNAIVETPGLFWHLEQLSHLQIARFLTHLQLDYFVGTPPAHVDRAFSSVDETLAAVLKVLANSDFATSLRSLSFGHVAASPQLDAASATFEHLRARWPHLQGDVTSLIRDGIRARLEVIEVPEAVAIVGLSAGETWQVPPHATIGSAPDSRLRLLGGHVPTHLASIHRSREGAWSIAAEGVDDMSSRASSSIRLNGTEVTRAALHPGDVIELMPGLKLRFVPE